MATEARIKYLERKVNAIKTVRMPNPKYKARQPETHSNPMYLDVDVETKYRKRFEKSARYLGYGVYEWQGVKATDTRALFLKGVLTMENIKFKPDED
jgi:hypothetical protein